MDSLNGS